MFSEWLFSFLRLFTKGELDKFSVGGQSLWLKRSRVLKSTVILPVSHKEGKAAPHTNYQTKSKAHAPMGNLQWECDGVTWLQVLEYLGRMEGWAQRGLHTGLLINLPQREMAVKIESYATKPLSFSVSHISDTKIMRTAQRNAGRYLKLKVRRKRFWQEPCRLPTAKVK